MLNRAKVSDERMMMEDSQQGGLGGVKSEPMEVEASPTEDTVGVSVDTIKVKVGVRFRWIVTIKQRLFHLLLIL